jgi:predicted small lipoprotein YifL
MLNIHLGGLRVTRIGTLVLVCSATLALASCGRRGPLEVPTESGATQPAQKTSGYSLDGGKRDDAPVVQKPNQPFVLDPIL